MKRLSFFLSIFAPEKRLLTWVMSLIVLFLMPYPTFGQTTGTLTIMENTRLRDHHEGNIIIGADRVRLDCRRFTVTGTGQIPGDGIVLSDRTGVTVKNCIVTNFGFGFLLLNSSSNTLKGNTAYDNSRGFVLMGNSSSNTLTGNTANGNRGEGFDLDNASSNILTGNTAYDNGFIGFDLLSSSSNTLKGNTAYDNSGGGFLLLNSSSNILTGNTANGNRGLGFRVIGFRNTLIGNTANDNRSGGFRVIGNINTLNTLIGNTANDNNSDGFRVSGFRNTLIGNTANANRSFGFRLVSSIESTLTENIANLNGDTGFSVDTFSTLNTFTENEGCDNTGFDAEDLSTGSNDWVDNNFCNPGPGI